MSRFIAAFFIFLFLSFPAWAKLSVQEIVDRANKTLRGDASHVHLTMTITTSRWSRSLEVEGWNRDRQEALILIHQPPKDKGTATLRLHKEMWVWKPSVERVIKIPPTMMQSSWMGSDFTYEDIVKADSIVKDYTHQVLEVQDQADGIKRYRVECLPNPDAAVVWGKVILLADLYPDGAALPVLEEDYSERGELIRTIAFSEVRTMQGRKVPTRMVCASHRKAGQSTQIHYRKIEFGVSFPDNFFSLERLLQSR
ncbi:MAG: outer membrane lipoprotein-sorting protein [Elusimicrobia bacterium]|nr:outer membrane lipoprotein-sorting protein [Elusimicrobiota bacterium]